MIQYSLICENDHGFDAWFKSASAFDDQMKIDVVTCPICATPKVHKALMAPSLGRKSNQRHASETATESPKSDEHNQSIALSAGHPEQAKLQQAIRDLREKITSEADYVGDNFAKEARKIHDQEVEPRGIYGEATPQEAASLIEDGVEFLPLPALPEEQN